MKKIFTILALIMLICAGCGIEPSQHSADITASPEVTVTPEPSLSIIMPEPAPGESVISEPTASPTAPPEPTAIPVVKNYKLNSDSIILRSGLKISDLENYYGLTGSDLIKKLGNEYELVDTGVEGTYEGYYYKKLGITLVFNDYDYSFDKAPLILIECDSNKLELNGLTPAMNFKQIQARIGKGKITKEETQEETQEYEYDMKYKIGKVILIFGSFTQDARDGYWVTIEYNYAL